MQPRGPHLAGKSRPDGQTVLHQVGAADIVLQFAAGIEEDAAIRTDQIGGLKLMFKTDAIEGAA